MKLSDLAKSYLLHWLIQEQNRSGNSANALINRLENPDSKITAKDKAILCELINWVSEP